MTRIGGELYAWSDTEAKRCVEQFETVAELDEPYLPYEFNTLRVVRHKPSGRMFWAQSSGCSCPTPFEEFFIEVEGENIVATDMNEITDATWDEFEREAQDFCSTASTYLTPIAADERSAFFAAVKAARKP